MKKLLHLLLPLALTASSGAAVLFQSGSFTGAGGTAPDGIISDINANPGVSISAVKFSVSTAVLIDTIELDGAYITAVPSTDNFTVAIYIGSTAPSSMAVAPQIVASARTQIPGATLVSFFSLYHYVLTPTAPLSLSAGDYWLVVANNTTSTGVMDSWYFAGSSATGGDETLAYGPTVDGPFSFSTGTTDLSFSLNGTAVPEPSAAALLGLAGLIVASRRARR